MRLPVFRTARKMWATPWSIDSSLSCEEGKLLEGPEKHKPALPKFTEDVIRYVNPRSIEGWSARHNIHTIDRVRIPLTLTWLTLPRGETGDVENKRMRRACSQQPPCESSTCAKRQADHCLVAVTL